MRFIFWYLTVTLVVGISALSTPAAHATSYNWTGNSSIAWSLASNWSPVGIPGAADSVTIKGNATVDLATNITVASLTMSPGAVLQGSGTVTVANTLTSTDATFAGSGSLNIPSSAVANLNNTSIGTNLKRRLTNSGRVNLNSGALILGATFTNNASGTLEVKDGATIGWTGASVPPIQNAGLLTKTAGTGTSTINTPVSNSGTVRLVAGTVSFSGGYTQTAGFTSLDGGNMSVKGGLGLQGGVLNGSGRITGDVNNLGGTISPGHSPGTITIDGNWTQASNGTLNMEIAGATADTQYDQLVVNGTATLNGTMSLVLLNGYMPSNGTSYQLITYYSVSGNFTSTTGLFPGNQRYFTITTTPTYYVVAANTDSTSPSVVVNPPAMNGAYRTLTSASGTSGDAGSGIASTTIVLYRYGAGKTAAGYWAGGSTWTSGYSASNERAVTGTASWTITLPSLTTMQYYVRATVKDRVGNTTTSTNNVFKIDGAAPASVTFTTPAASSYGTALPSVAGTAADNSGGSGISRVDLLIKRSSDNKYWNGSLWTSTSSPLATSLSGSTWTRSDGSSSPMPSGSNLTAGSYVLTATAYDIAGNALSSSVTYTIDLLAPTAIIKAPLNQSIYTSLSSASGTTADTGGSGVGTVTAALYRYPTATVSAGYWAGGTSWTSTYGASNERVTTGTTSWSLTLPTLTPGQYSLRVTVKDKVGNTGVPVISVFTKSAGTSTVALSFSSASAGGSKVQLNFTSALDAVVAADALRYTVTVNSVAVPVLSATYTGTTFAVTLTVPSGSIPAGSKVIANWKALLDTSGKTLTGQTPQLTAQ